MMNTTMNAHEVIEAAPKGTNTLILSTTPWLVHEFACGDYQRALLRGEARWSGADLKGKAAKWGLQYERSRAHLVARLQRAGYRVEFRRGTGHEGPLMCVIIDG